MTSDPKRRRCRSILLVVGAPLALVVAVYAAKAIRMPQDAPLARMYRTEAELAALVKAVDTYRGDHGAYPPAGAEGLRAATDHLSRNVLYLPDGPPLDGWRRAYHYVPSTCYENAGSGAFRGAEGFHAPGRYQIYSVGADGQAGIDNAEARRDNVTSWDSGKSWRNTYQALQKAYDREQRNP
ncbi:MAG: hypothetical protein GY851_00610 [bacterium]|nr:hypothetical protein [bacterium]